MNINFSIRTYSNKQTLHYIQGGITLRRLSNGEVSLPFLTSGSQGKVYGRLPMFPLLASLSKEAGG